MRLYKESTPNNIMGYDYIASDNDYIIGLSDDVNIIEFLTEECKGYVQDFYKALPENSYWGFELTTYISYFKSIFQTSGIICLSFYLNDPLRISIFENNKGIDLELREAGLFPVGCSGDSEALYNKLRGICEAINNNKSSYSGINGFRKKIDDLKRDIHALSKVQSTNNTTTKH